MSPSEILGWAAAGVVAGMAGAAAVTVVARALHKRAVRRIVPDPSPRDFLPYQERVVHLRAPEPGAARRVRTALEGLPRTGEVEERRSADGRLRIATRARRGFGGEIVEARIEPEGSDGSRVHLSSRPRLPFPRYDLGANLKTLLFLEGKLGGTASPSGNEIN